MFCLFKISFDINILMSMKSRSTLVPYQVSMMEETYIYIWIRFFGCVFHLSLLFFLVPKIQGTACSNRFPLFLVLHYIIGILLAVSHVSPLFTCNFPLGHLLQLSLISKLFMVKIHLLFSYCSQSITIFSFLKGVRCVCS